MREPSASNGRIRLAPLERDAIKTPRRLSDLDRDSRSSASTTVPESEKASPLQARCGPLFLDPLQSPFSHAQMSPSSLRRALSPLPVRRANTCPEVLAIQSGSQSVSVSDDNSGLNATRPSSAPDVSLSAKKSIIRRKQRCRFFTIALGDLNMQAPTSTRTSSSASFSNILNEASEAPLETSSETPRTIASTTLLPSKPVQIRSWKFGSRIGQGSYGSVHKALDTEQGIVFAVKKAAIGADKQYLDRLQDELDILKNLQHSNIVSYFGHEVKEGSLCIFMEYLPNGSMSAVLEEFGALRGSVLRSATVGMLQGLSYLHTRRPVVIHRDVKSSNVLVDSFFNVKLSDFGCSKRCDLSTSFTMLGSIPWMAPEMISLADTRMGYGRKADMWSYGCTLIEFLTAGPPWGKGYFDNVMYALSRIGLSKDTPPIPECASSSLQSLLSICLNRDPSCRLKASDLLRHDFFHECPQR